MGQNETVVITRKEHTFRPPSPYDVIMWNDDVTPMEFVVLVLMDVFEYEKDAAVKKMLSIHHSRGAVVGTYPKSVAEFKLQRVEEYKSDYGFTSFRVEIREHQQI